MLEIGINTIGLHDPWLDYRGSWMDGWLQRTCLHFCGSSIGLLSPAMIKLFLLHFYTKKKQHTVEIKDSKIKF